MKIVIVDFAASEGGAMTILKQYYDMAVLDKDNHYTFLTSDKYFKETKNIDIVILKKDKKWFRRLLFDHCIGRRLIRQIEPDKVISLQNTIVRGITVPQELYVHQAIPFQTIKKFSFFKKDERKFAIIQYFIGHEIKESIKKADRVIVQTNWMKKAIVDQCKICANKVSVEIPIVKKNHPKCKIGYRKNQFFCPTSDAIYKNNEVIFDAVKVLEEDGFDDFVIEMTLNGKSSKHLKRIGRLSHDDVMRKYQESVLIFPSYIETIGLPLLEAREYNARIIAADTEFAREALGGYDNVLFFNPFIMEELVAILKKEMEKEYE